LIDRCISAPAAAFLFMRAVLGFLAGSIKFELNLIPIFLQI